MNSGIGAAVEIAREIGLDVAEPVLVQETNNTVVWLWPHAIIAKVGTRTGSYEALVREFEVATALAGLGAPFAPPLPDSSPQPRLPFRFDEQARGVGWRRPPSARTHARVERFAEASRSALAC
jgi:hypothetical protein